VGQVSSLAWPLSGDNLPEGEREALAQKYHSLWLGSFLKSCGKRMLENAINL